MKKLLVCLTAACMLFASCIPVPDPENKNPASNTETNNQTPGQQDENGDEDSETEKVNSKSKVLTNILYGKNQKMEKLLL